MPLIQKKSKKAFEHNIKAEMEAGKPQKQSLAIAFSVKRKPKKMAKGGEAQLNAMEVTPDKGYGKIIRVGMAEGGSISAKTEKRPMSDQSYNDSEMGRKNKGMKSPKQDSWTDTPTETQAAMNNGRKVMPIARPKMVPSNAFSTKLYNKEGMLEESAKPGSYGEQPPQDDNEMEADKSGDPVRKDPIHSKNLNKYAKGGDVKSNRQSRWETLKAKAPHLDTKTIDGMLDREDQKARFAPKTKLANGGMINDDVSMKDAEEDEVQHPAGLEMDNDEMSPPEDEIMSNHMKMLAEGGMADDMDQPEHEEEEEHHSSIASAIMARREKLHAQIDSGAHDYDEAVRMADGGQVDIDENAEEQPNDYYGLNEDAALKENYDSDMDSLHQPMDSNEHGDEREEESENKHDMISILRRKMMSKRR